MALTPHDLVLEAKQHIQEISCQQAQQWCADGATAIDVREYDEFAAGHLPGAVHLPRGMLEFMIGKLPQAADQHAPLLVYCRSSGRAALSAVQLQLLGYGQVRSLAGGFEQWASQGLPVAKPVALSFE